MAAAGWVQMREGKCGRGEVWMCDPLQGLELVTAITPSPGPHLSPKCERCGRARCGASLTLYAACMRCPLLARRARSTRSPWATTPTPPPISVSGNW